MTSRRTLLITGLAAGAAAFSGLAHAAGDASKDNRMSEGQNLGSDRPLRRKDRLLTDTEALIAIRNTDHAVLSTVDKDGYPYGVPVTPVYYEGKIYFHGSADKKGRKTVNMLANPNVSLCYTAKDTTVPEQFAVNFVSVVVAGTARPITDRETKAKLMHLIAHRHASVMTDKQVDDYMKPEIDLITLWEVTPRKITGKSRNKQYYFDGLTKK